ncbi:MAG TPA: glycosyltransferase family 39 protein [Thermoanaerobaculia bacterium]|nr:glycosyltransferase family 39 protein [Thermoanaerobaculia bacterium]
MRPSPALLLGLAAVAAVRLLTLPESLWEWDEVLFVRGILDFDPLHHSPHPPGYPLLIGLGKALTWITGDPFTSLVALSVISSCVGFVALAVAFQSFSGSEQAGVTGALLFHFSPAMLVYGPLALSDPVALMFLALALAAAGRLIETRGLWSAVALGVFASAAIGCRPQLSLAILPMLAVTLFLARKQSAAVLGAFTLVSLAWFVPLLVAVGGPSGFLPFLSKQAGLVVAYDTTGSRSELSWIGVAKRFLAHPWGDRWLSMPLLGLAAIGGALVVFRRYRTALPLAVLSVVELTFAMTVMNAQDAVRYALPGLLGIAFLAGVGAEALTRRLRIPAAALAILFAAGAIRYTAPILEARTKTPSPPVQAIEWARQNLPPQTVFLMEPVMAAYIDHLLPKSERLLIDEGLQLFAAKPGRPVYLLGDGESGWPGAKTFRWPESDAYGKLSRAGLYRVTSLSPIPPGRRYRIERGVYGYEPSAREPKWRWLAPDAAVRLYSHGITRSSLTLALPESAPWPSNRVMVVVGGAPAADVEILRGGQKRVEIPLPASSEVEVAFQSASSFVPAETGAGPDTRRLAVQLVDLEMRGFQGERP